jgi:hypothetical protein
MLSVLSAAQARCAFPSAGLKLPALAPKDNFRHTMSFAAEIRAFVNQFLETCKPNPAASMLIFAYEALQKQ